MTDQKDLTKTSIDISEETDIHWSQDISYGGYLKLGKLLECQEPLSDEHDEMLFIVIHQSAELWMKCCIHELMAAMECVKKNTLGPAFKMLSRIARIQAQLEQSWDVLSTLTPADYAKFRDQLGQSSGFQSYQYRTIEFALGNKNAAMINAHKDNPKRYDALSATLHAPSFYDLVIALLAKRGFPISKTQLQRDFSQPYVADESVENAWLQIYRNPEKEWELYELAEKLVDLEHQFHSWRFSHMKTVERIIGYKQGTGGTGGVSYLVKALDIRFFPELWTARTKI
ncbi:tryptophan 2,3-dioxygenase [Temperatibacter marinus]|uniref:Tryptophan 2,3-dioxygenase n=1 Tax=Temperatibacter marinus TaxID=1456591 RepID=A0AA52EIJ1_9PROT|nr:tryptophan 2,3-dioxygenase [Temperatibacter marinus]WND03445.1 tryptophan 2,3-dioxygenase [Temperatibacter marinus]